MAAALAEVSASPDAASLLGVSPGLRDEVARNLALGTAPATPAAEVYTGVLYDALDVDSMTRGQRARAGRRLAVGSALFGLVPGEDPIPAYRLSAGSALPGLPTLRTLWKPALSPVLAGFDDLAFYDALATPRETWAVPVRHVPIPEHCAPFDEWRRAAGRVDY